MRYIIARGFLPALAALALAALAACGGGDRGGNTSGDIVPVVISSDSAVGPNRFLVGLVDQDQKPVLDAQIHFRFFKLDGDKATLKSETDATSIRITRTYSHTHEDGKTETHEAGETGAYVANVTFDAPGIWAVEVSGTASGNKLEPISAAFSVREKSQTPALGQPAPRSIQTILKDVADITEIDTSDPPNPDMHNMTIAQAVTSGKPTIIVFATPAFCQSLLCGPAKEVVDDLYKEYKGQANFVHVEPYDLKKARGGQGLEPLPFITEEWGLPSEPWIFLVDRQGMIAAKFEGLVGAEELKAAFIPLLGTAG